MVLGDSNVTKWNKFSAAFPQELSCELQIPVDTISASDGGINEARLNLLREYRKDQGCLERKKVLIWVFTIRAVLKARPCFIDIPLNPADEAERNPG